MLPFGDACQVSREDLKKGDIIKIRMKIDLQDIANPCSLTADR